MKGRDSTMTAGIRAAGDQYRSTSNPHCHASENRDGGTDEAQIVKRSHLIALRAKAWNGSPESDFVSLPHVGRDQGLGYRESAA